MPSSRLSFRLPIVAFLHKYPLSGVLTQLQMTLFSNFWVSSLVFTHLQWTFCLVFSASTKMFQLGDMKTNFQSLPRLISWELILVLYSCDYEISIIVISLKKQNIIILIFLPFLGSSSFLWSSSFLRLSFKIAIFRGVSYSRSHVFTQSLIQVFQNLRYISG